MTRETKIGLLVGLAFIIVIGILLSDHLTSSTEPPPATLANAGSNVMQTINTPGGAHVPPVNTSDAAPQRVAPSQPVPSSADLSPRPQPVQVVQIGPGSARDAQAPPITVQQSDAPRPQSHPQVAAVEPPVITMPQHADQSADRAPAPPADDTPLITQMPGALETSLAQAAQRVGEQLVGLDDSGRVTETATPPVWTQGVSGLREHKAEPGDSVSRMAARFLGGDTKANRELIVRANPSLQKDPNKVILGHTYMIPVLSGPAVATAPQPQSPQALPAQPGGSVASVSEYWYTVKENDTLWKIAQEQLGDASARTAIKELNKLQDENRIYVGMKLKLPGKPVAQAQ